MQSPQAFLINKLTFAMLVALATPAVLASPYTGTVLYPLSVASGFTYTGASGFPETISGNGTVGDALSMNQSLYHAVFWPNPTGLPVDLNPSGFDHSKAYGTIGNQQVGIAQNGNSGNSSYAMLWTGSASSAVNLTPAGYTYSEAFGTDGVHQVGDANGHAILWSGTAASAVDLGEGSARAVYGSEEVGSRAVAGGAVHAVLWHGTAASVVDLNPQGVLESYASGTDGTEQVGGGYMPGQNDHAYLWFGSAQSAVDLNPANMDGSEAYGTNGNQQVGSAGTSAYVWSGTAGSAVNLQPFLPSADNWEHSIAYTIDDSGRIFGIAIGTVNGVRAQYAVEWTAVPEPFSVSVFIAFPLLCSRRRRDEVRS